MQCLANYSRLLSLRDTSAVLLFKVAELLCIQKSSSDQIRGKEHSFQLITSYLADREIYEWYRRSLRIRVYEIFVRQLRNSEIFMRISLAVFGNEKLRVHRQGQDMSSVWRNAGAPGALDLSGIRSAQVDMIPDDDSCDICMGEDGACDVWFSPCGHKACASCVQKMRIANVYKADKGVRCPFCRQVIETYLDAPPPRRPVNSPFPPESASFTLVMGGNVEAGSKAVPEIKKPYGRGGIVSIGGGNDYIPPKGVTGSDGGGLRSNTRMDDLLPGYVVPPLKDTDDIVSMAMDRTGARHLDFMLRDAYAKRHKVAKLCREMLTPFAAKLAVHASGNYVLQRMLEYAATHRGEGGNTESFFTAIVRSFAQDKGLVMAAQDHRGTFSVQKMLVSLKGAEEATLVAQCIRGSVVQLALDQFGVYVLERLVEALITSLNPAPGKKGRVPSKVATKILAQICEEMQADSKALASIAKHQVSGIMLVECIRWALPQSEAMAAAIGIADMSGDLVGSKLSHRTLQGILSLEVKDVAERVIQGLQGHYVELAADTTGCGFKLVRACLATPCVGENMRLLIVDELLSAVKYPSGHHSWFDTTAGIDTFAFGLCLLTRRVLDERMDSLIMHLERDKYLVFRDRVENLRKHFFNETPQPSIPHLISSAPSTPAASQVTRARSLDHNSATSVNSRVDLTSNSMSGFLRFPHGQVISDPWSEEGPSGGLFSTDHIEKSLTRVISLPNSRPSTPSTRLMPLESASSGESPSLVEQMSTQAVTSSSSGTLVARMSSNPVGSSTYTPPHLRDKKVPLSLAQSGLGASQAQLPGSEARSSSYAPPHMRQLSPSSSMSATGFSDFRYETESSANGSFGNGHVTGNSPTGGSNGQSLLPYGSSDFLDFSSETIDPPALKKNNDDGGAAEAVKPSGSHRQPGICAVCNRDAANTVLLACSHMCCCTACSRVVTVCPICHNKVSTVIDIRPVGMPPSPSSSLQPQPNSTSNAWDMSSVSNAASAITTRLIEVSSGGNLNREILSRHSPASSQFQSSESPFESNTVTSGTSLYSIRHLPSDHPPPGIPALKPTSSTRSMSSQSASSVTAIPQVSSSMGRPLYIPSDFFPTAMSGNQAPGSNVSITTASSFAQHTIQPSPVNNSFTNMQSSVVNPPTRRPPAPYRPPGLYRPPDLYARPAPPVVSSQAPFSNSDFTSMAAAQWRTY